MEDQGVVQPPVGAHPGQRVQLLPVGGDILAVLVVGVSHGLETLPHLLALVPLTRGLAELGGGIALHQLLDILTQLQGAHLQDLHGLEHLGGQFQRLFQGQLQIHGDFSSRQKITHKKEKL